MKKSALLLILAMTLSLTAMAQSLGVIIDTNGDGYTNVRNKPNGTIVDVLHDGDMIHIDRCLNGWFHLASRIYMNDGGEEYSLPSGTALWVHYSQVTAYWLYDGGLKFVLRSTPSSSGSIVFRGTDNCTANHIKHILDYKNSWVKVRLESGKTGWVQQNLICGNALTVCN